MELRFRGCGRRYCEGMVVVVLLSFLVCDPDVGQADSIEYGVVCSFLREELPRRDSQGCTSEYGPRVSAAWLELIANSNSPSIKNNLLLRMIEADSSSS